MTSLTRLTTVTRPALIGVLLAAQIAIVAPNPFWRYLLTSVLISFILISSFNIIFGYAGQLALSHTVVYALGAYTSALLSIRLGMPFLLALLAGVVIGAIGGLLIAVPTARLGGIFLTIGTLAFGIAGEEVLLKWTDVTGGVQGLMGIPVARIGGLSLVPGQLGYLVFVALLALLAAEGSFRFSQGPLGQRFIALRDNERFIRAVGISPQAVRRQAFLLSGALAGLAGGLFAHLTQFLSAPSFSLAIMIQVLVALLLGGAGSAWGPVLGAAALLGIQEGGHHLGDPSLVMGLAIIVLIVAAPRGLAGILKDLASRWLPAALVASLRPAHAISETGESSRPEADAKGATPASALLLSRNSPEGEVTRPDLLEVTDLEVTFGGVKAVDRVSLSIPVGRVTGLIGPNGAGKTSLVNAVTGYVSVRGGRVRWGEHELLGMNPERIAGTGLVRTFQRSQLVGSLDLVSNVMVARARFRQSTMIEEFLHLPRSLRDQQAARDEALALLERLNIAPFAYDFPGDVSYGVVRRCEVARALAQEPALLMLDEPGAGLTAQERQELAVTINELAAAGLGVLLIDHNVTLVSETCSHVHVLVGGRELAAGAPAAVLENAAVLESYFGRAGAK